MTVVRRIARPLLAAVFIQSGVQVLRNPKPVVPAADPVAQPGAQKIPGLPEDSEQLVKINAGVQIGAGALFALGKFPRLSALALAGSLVPTTLAGHRFWEEKGSERSAQQIHFLKNAGLLGGLLIAAVDTEGKPSLAWRMRHAGKTASRAVEVTRKEAKLATKAAKTSAKANAKANAKAAKATAKANAKAAKSGAKAARGGAKAAKGAGRAGGKAALAKLAA